MLAVAGAAASVNAQNYTIEAQLVVDGDALAPTGAGIDTFLPGAQATRVGLTLMARVRQNNNITTSGVGNYGIAGVNNASSSNPTRFTHNDTTFSGGTYQPFGRGRVSTTLGTDSLPLAGAFSEPRNFRKGAIDTPLTPGVADINTLNTNQAGATGTNAPSANGFFPAAGAQLSGIAAIAYNLGNTDLGTTSVASLGTFSPWYNIYRVYFDPKPNASDPVRDVTVSFFGRFFAATRFFGGNYTFGGQTGATLDTTVSATFQVPTPGAAALLGLGGLLAARRRRA
jgi:MYXO-CTERM domain-containing protein